MNTPLSLFSQKDQATMAEIYQRLFALFKVLQPVANRGDIEDGDFDLVKAVPIGEIPPLTRDLGIETLDGSGDERLPRAIHDIRGGCLAAVVSCYDMVCKGIFPWNRKSALQLFRMVRDHLKMFRNCVPEIDPEAVHRDRSDRGHSIDLLTEKWQDADYQLGAEKALNVSYHCQYQGTISERCMEFSALDRIVYNCMNNAGRFAVEGRVYFHIFPIDEQDAPGVLRFALVNRVSAEHLTTLKKTFDGDMSAIFEARKSTDSSGYGLNICAEFVASAFGLQNASAAVEQKHIGATLVDDCFIIWFHWPTVV